MNKAEIVCLLEMILKIIIKTQTTTLVNYQLITNLLVNAHKTVHFMIAIIKNVFHVISKIITLTLKI
jgi:hypothetical protein